MLIRFGPRDSKRYKIVSLFLKKQPDIVICLVFAFIYYSFIAKSSSPYVLFQTVLLLISENLPTSTFIPDRTFIQDLRVFNLAMFNTSYYAYVKRHTETLSCNHRGYTRSEQPMYLCTNRVYWCCLAMPKRP